jgi:hypothetical protein
MYIVVGNKKIIFHFENQLYGFCPFHILMFLSFLIATCIYYNLLFVICLLFSYMISSFYLNVNHRVHQRWLATYQEENMSPVINPFVVFDLNGVL